MNLNSRITEIKGIGEKTAKSFEKLNIFTVGDLIGYFPRGYEIFEEPVPIADCEIETSAAVRVFLDRPMQNVSGRRSMVTTAVFTDENGEAIFSNVEDGSYRIIEIIDKEYFEKPKYINWNEITIDCNNKKEKILIVNKLKKYRS